MYLKYKILFPQTMKCKILQMYLKDLYLKYYTTLPTGDPSITHTRKVSVTQYFLLLLHLSSATNSNNYNQSTTVVLYVHVCRRWKDGE